VRTFTFSDAKSHKFWNIDLKGSQFTVTYGRIGADGQTQVKEFANAGAAEKAHDKLIAEKTGKGYVETTGAGKAAGKSGKPGNSNAPASETGSLLEKALADDPDDLATAQAYADELSERGDPRGELIQVQLALEDSKQTAAQRKKLQAREQELLKKHRAVWLGPKLVEVLKAERSIKFAMARGWLSSIRFGDEFGVEAARALVNSPAARLLRELSIGDMRSYSDEFEPGPDVPERADEREAWAYPLFKAPFLGSLRKLTLGETEAYTHIHGEQIANLVERLPRIEELHIAAHLVDAAKLFRLKNLTGLRRLALHCNKSYPLEVLAKNPALGQLESIKFHPHALEFGEDDDDEQAFIKLSALKALVGSKTLTSLKHVSLNLTRFGDKGVDLIIKSGVLKRWKTLDLSGGAVTDAGAAALADCPDLKNLERLNLSSNSLTPAGIKQLKATKVPLVADSQHSGEDDEYMYEGDWE
jgi:uncharacterized protein (TIGR02996 family)